MFRKLVISFAAAAGLMSQFALPAEAGIRPPAHPRRLPRLAETSPIENAQFMWGGRNYCWYNSAWRGPGWYWCGHAWRRGTGWGGAAGWHGWRHPGSSVGPSAGPSTGPRFTTGRLPIAPAITGPAILGHVRPPAHRPGGGHNRPPAHRPGAGGGGQRR